MRFCAIIHISPLPLNNVKVKVRASEQMIQTLLARLHNHVVIQTQDSLKYVLQCCRHFEAPFVITQKCNTRSVGLLLFTNRSQTICLTARRSITVTDNLFVRLGSGRFCLDLMEKLVSKWTNCTVLQLLFLFWKRWSWFSKQLTNAQHFKILIN